LNSHQRRIFRRAKRAALSLMLGNSRSILIPMIRKVFPTMIANQIVGVQPMTAPTGQIHTLRTSYAPRPKFTVLSERKRWTILTSVATWYTVSCGIDVRNWIMETFPDDEHTLWQENQDQDVFHCVVEIHEKVFNFLKLKWS
jgi:hypothetical protein